MRIPVSLVSIIIVIASLLLVIGCSTNAGNLQTDAIGKWQISNSNIAIRELPTITILNANNWWAAKNDGTLLYSTSGGKEWNAIYELPQRKVIGASLPDRVEKIQFLNEKVGWLLAAKLMFTEDSGTSWKEVQPDRVNPNGEAPVLRSFYFIDQNRGWVVGNILEDHNEVSAAVLWETLDGGKQWKRIKCLKCDEREVFWSVDASRDGKVWILGNMIYRKTLGSDQIQEIRFDLSKASSQIVNVEVAEPNVVWAETGDGKSYFISQDSGINWTEVKLPMPYDKIIFIDTQQAYLASNGEVSYSQDGGRSWNVEIRGEYRQLYMDSNRQLLAAIGQKVAVKRLD